MTLSLNQFTVLNELRKEAGLTQRKLAQRSELSLGTVNSVVRDCEEMGLISERTITEDGIAALNPYKVDNAVIMAAGLSSRFAPISYEKPKGVLKVRGEILVERQIRQLQAAGITDITIVVGYKKEYFFWLEAKHNVSIVVNPEYDRRNNHSTLWYVRHKLANTYICSSDNYFTENPFEPYVWQAYYSAVYVDGPTKEWCLTVDANDRITEVSVGGKDSWTMLGHAFFDRHFSQRFTEILREEYDHPETIDKLWEAIYVDHIDELPMVMRRYPEGIINEFDSLEELQGFDPAFMKNVDSEIFDNISSALKCNKADIHSFFPLKQGLTNLSCHFTVNGEEYVYRHPGVGTEKLVDRHAEAAALELARDLGIDSTFICEDIERGWKISRYVPNSRNLDPNNPQEVGRAMELCRTLHDSGAVLERDFDFLEQGLEYERLLKEHGPIDLPGYDDLREKVIRLKKYADADGYPKCISHNDFFPLNFVIDQEGEINLIDWEYAGMSDVANDFGTFTVCSQLTAEQADAALVDYFGRKPEARERCHFWAYVVLAGWCWYVWALLKGAEGDEVDEWLYIYYTYAADYVDQVLALYEQSESMSDHSDSDAAGTAA